MYSIHYSKRAADYLKKADKILALRIIKKIENLAINPVPPDAVSTGRTEHLNFRVRIGKYRILYEVDFSTKSLGIIKIDKRDSVYN